MSPTFSEIPHLLLNEQTDPQLKSPAPEQKLVLPKTFPGNEKSPEKLRDSWVERADAASVTKQNPGR